MPDQQPDQQSGQQADNYGQQQGAGSPPSGQSSPAQGQDQQKQGGSTSGQSAQGSSQSSQGKGGNEDSPAKKVGRRVIIGLVVLLLICGALFWYWRSTFTEDTDDAQVDGDIYQISSKVTGQVQQVFVNENTIVHKGDLLVQIDPRDQQVALEQAEAQLANARASYASANVNVPITSVQTRTTISTSGSDVATAEAGVAQSQQQVAAAQARIVQAQANAVKAAKDVERYTPLVERDVISRQQYDAAIAEAQASAATVQEAQKNLDAQQAAVTAANQRVAQAKANAAQAQKNAPDQVRAQQARAEAAMADIKTAQARVDQATLNLSYTRIVAPVSGVVNKKNVDAAANLSAGQNLMSITPLNDLWVTANFKETQLSKMHRCQEVDIKVDALGGRTFHGKITQIGGATGSKLSLFPAENATGNYVKVVQRIPVRIDFTDLNKENGDYALRPGFSVTPDVSVKGTGDDKNSPNCEAGLPEHQTK